MTSPTNRQRAAWAKAAVIAYSEAKQERLDLYDEVTYVASDLFTDLLHLFDALRAYRQKMIDRAIDHHAVETREEEG